MYNQLYAYLTERDIRTEYRFGFFSLYSTVTALLNVTNECYLNIDKGMPTSVVFLDLAKAFDTIFHAILLRKLELCDITGVSTNWFKSYLSNRQKQCITENSISKPRTVNYGVLQGCILELNLNVTKTEYNNVLWHRVDYLM